MKNLQWKHSYYDSAELYLQDGDGLGEVVLLHGGGGVQGGQWMVKLLQVRVAVSPVVQVVAQAGYQQTLFLQKGAKKKKETGKNLTNLLSHRVYFESEPLDSKPPAR